MLRVLIAAVITLTATASTEPSFSAQARKQFESRVAAYLKLRHEAVSQIPVVKKDAEPEQIRANKLAQADAIRRARAGAKQGDVFTADFEQYAKGVLAGVMGGVSGKSAKQTAMAGNPAKEDPSAVPKIAVNTEYPGDAPLSSVPPTLLLKLPELPKELDYRFVGRTLILHDVNSGLIVDYMRDSIPRQ